MTDSSASSNSSASTPAITAGKAESRITSRLTELLAPVHLEVINESHKHNVPPESETHFKIVAVSGEFDGLSLVNRHRVINKALSSELQSGVHALAMQTHTPQEWVERGGRITDTPNCLGGDGRAGNN